MADDDSSELSSVSSLSSAPSEDDGEIEVKREKGILKFFHKLPQGTKPEPKKESTPPPRKRSPSPAHEYVFADNPDIAVRDSFFYRAKNAKCRVSSFKLTAPSSLSCSAPDSTTPCPNP